MAENKVPDLIQYAQNHKDVPLSEKSLNDVDALILAELSYMDWSDLGIDYPGDGTITLRDAILNMDPDKKAKRGEEMVALLDILAESERFGNMTLSNFSTHSKDINHQDVSDFEDLEQFSAVVITYTDENGETRNYISYSGTNNTLEGWCEDFNMAYDTMTEAQRLSVEYLEGVIGYLEGDVDMGGHSKGGNDAVFAYLFCDEDTRSRISKIYVYDAPGMTPGICYEDREGNVVQLDPEIYRQMMERLKGVCPYDSVIGQLLNEYEYVFVDTEGPILADHSAFTWRIDPETGEFIFREQSEISKFFDEVFDEWILSLPPEQREIFMDAVWSWIYSIGAETFDDVLTTIGDHPFKSIASLIEYINTLPEDQRESFLKTVGYIVLLVTDNALENYMPGYETIREKIRVEFEKRNITDWESLWEYIRQAPIENTMDLLQSILMDWDVLVALVEAAATIVVVNIILRAAVTLLKAALMLVIRFLPIIAAVVAVLVVCKLAIDFIREHWEEIKALALQAMEFVQQKINEFVQAMKLAIRTGFNAALATLAYMAEEIAQKVYNFGEEVADVLQNMGRLASQSLQQVLRMTNPLLYGVVRLVGGIRQAMVTVDMQRLQDAVDEMDRLAIRVGNMDTRLSNLFWEMCQENIEKEEGIFTSIANMYNLARADINVDQGSTIRRKANAISELFTEYSDAEKWILGQLGG